VPDIQKLIDKLQSANSSARYDACEELRVAASIPAKALTALRAATKDKDPQVADAASRALAAHTATPAADPFVSAYFKESNPGPPPDPAQAPLDQREATLFKILYDGLHWFSVIGVFSIWASFRAISGNEVDVFVRQVFGLGVTELINTIIVSLGNALHIPSLGTPALFILGVLAPAGVFYAYGWLGRRGYRLAVIGGIALYAADAVPALASGQWFAVAWHAIGLWVLWKGLRAMTTVTRLQEAESAGDATAVQQLLSSLPAPVDPVKRRRNLVWFSVIVIAPLLILFAILVVTILTTH